MATASSEQGNNSFEVALNIISEQCFEEYVAKLPHGPQRNHPCGAALFETEPIFRAFGAKESHLKVCSLARGRLQRLAHELCFHGAAIMWSIGYCAGPDITLIKVESPPRPDSGATELRIPSMLAARPAGKLCY